MKPTKTFSDHLREMFNLKTDSNRLDLRPTFSDHLKEATEDGFLKRRVGVLMRGKPKLNKIMKIILYNGKNFYMRFGEE